MSIPQYFALMLPLGLGGFDPAPMFIALYYLTKNPGRAGRRTVLGFSVLLVGGTMVWGMFLTLLFGERIAHIPWRDVLHFLLSAGMWTTLGKLVIGTVLLGFAGFRFCKILRGAAGKAKEPKKDRTAWGLMLVALGFVLIVTTDLPYDLFISASSAQPLWAQVLGISGWALISQSPLVLYALAVALGKEAVFSRTLEKVRARLEVILAYAIPTLAAIVGAALVLDAVLFALLHVVLVPILHI